MISEKCSFREFIDAVKDMDFLEMICLTDQEATYAERLAIKTFAPEDRKYSTCGRYSSELKSLILFLRHGVKPSIIKDHNLESILCRDQGDSVHILSLFFAPLVLAAEKHPGFLLFQSGYLPPFGLLYLLLRLGLGILDYVIRLSSYLIQNSFAYFLHSCHKAPLHKPEQIQRHYREHQAQDSD